MDAYKSGNVICDNMNLLIYIFMVDMRSFYTRFYSKLIWLVTLRYFSPSTGLKSKAG